jgi:hypothetical protein
MAATATAMTAVATQPRALVQPVMTKLPMTLGAAASHIMIAMTGTATTPLITAPVQSLDRIDRSDVRDHPADGRIADDRGRPWLPSAGGPGLSAISAPHRRRRRPTRREPGRTTSRCR